MWTEKPKHQDIVLSYFNEGMRTDVIADELGISVRQVQRILRDALGPYQRGPGPSTQAQNKLSDVLRDIVIQLMRQEGRDFTRCELCGEPIPAGQWNLHHTKYEGATYQDLRIVCRACNVSRANRYLT